MATDGSLYRERVARRNYHCGRECGAVIEAGTKHVLASLPPHDPEVGNTTWWHMRLHGRDYNDCPRYHPEAIADVREIAVKELTR